MLTMLLYVLIVGLVAALLFLVASAVFGRSEELGPLPEGTTETVLPAEGISGADVRDLRFQQVFRGYKAGEVDWALARLAARIDELHTQLAQARSESSPQRTELAPAEEQTGSGAAPQTGGPHPATEHPPATPATPGEIETVRTERQGGTLGDERTVRTERRGDTPGDQRPLGENGGAQAALHGFEPAPADPPYSPADPPHSGPGPIPWGGPDQTGPWEAPPVDANGTTPAPPGPQPNPWTGLVPGLSGTPQPPVAVSISTAQHPGGVGTGSAPPNGQLAGNGANTASPGIADTQHTMPTPGTDPTGSLTLPPIAPGQPATRPGGPGQWPGNPGPAAAGQQ